MSIVSEIINIKNNGNPTTEYVEAELKKQGITPLRWAIVKIGNDFFTINVAYDKIAMG
ncbi:hypothetical protein IKJ53_02135 [bacterium]|nr:hypothetical protein [bacterium]